MVLDAFEDNLVLLPTGIMVKQNTIMKVYFSIKLNNLDKFIEINQFKKQMFSFKDLLSMKKIFMFHLLMKLLKIVGTQAYYIANLILQI